MQRIRSNDAAGRGFARLCTAVAVALVGASLLTLATEARSQELEKSIRQPWSLYVFVSSKMPRQSLVSLAREASRAHATMVFRGCAGATFDLQGQERLVAELNAACCNVTPAGASASPLTRQRAVAPAWSVDPALYRRFAVDVVPTFVLVANGATGDQSFSKVSGDMALASALKYVAQGSSITAARRQAAALYQATYGGRE